MIKFELKGKRGMGHYAIVDLKTYKVIKRWRWYLSENGYVWRTGCKNYHTFRIYLHRLVIGARSGQEVDHINRDKLDNRRVNLRFCSRSENTQNQGLRSDNKSGIRGVEWRKDLNKWRVRKQINGVRKNVGYALTLIEAAAMLDDAV